MNNLLKVISGGENECLEFKESLRLKEEIGQTVSAFSNANGGLILKERAEKPVFFKNHTYKRVGKTNQQISSSELRKLAKESGAKVYWDEEVCEDANLDDIDEEKIRRFLRRARYERRLELDLETQFEEALEKLELLRKGKLTNAALLLFGKNPQRVFNGEGLK